MRPPLPKRACHSKITRVPLTERNRRASRSVGWLITRSLSGVTLQVQDGAAPSRHAPAARSRSLNRLTTVESSPAFNAVHWRSTSGPNVR